MAEKLFNDITLGDIRRTSERLPDVKWSTMTVLALVSEIERLGRRNVPDDWDGEHCQDCGCGYATVWNAPDKLWEKVTGITDGSGLRCPACFEREAKARGITIYWSGDDSVFAEEKFGEIKDVIAEYAGNEVASPHQHGWRRRIREIIYRKRGG